MPHHRSVKAALIGVAVASLLCIILAYVAAYQATARPQGPNAMIVLYEQAIPTGSERLTFYIYLLPCDDRHPGYAATIIKGHYPLVDSQEDALVRIPTAPPCP